MHSKITGLKQILKQSKRQARPINNIVLRKKATRLLTPLFADPDCLSQRWSYYFYSANDH